MRSQSRVYDIKQGDLVQMTDEMISFYNVYGPPEPGFLSGEPVLVLESSLDDDRAQVIDSLGNIYSTSLQKIRRL
jgi:hypothetical protein